MVYKSSMTPYGCFCKLGGSPFKVGVPVIRALQFRVYIKSPDLDLEALKGLVYREPGLLLRGSLGFLLG